MKMENKWKLVIIISFCLSIVSVFMSGVQMLMTTPTDRVYLETETIVDEHGCPSIVLFNPYDFCVYDIYLVYRLVWYNNSIRLENSEDYTVIRRDMLGANATCTYGPFSHPHNYTCQVVHAYAYGEKPSFP